MDCRNCQPVLVDLLYDELSTDAAAQARRHMGQCATCTRDFEQLQASLQLAQQLPEVEPPQAPLDAIMREAQQHAQSARVRRSQAAPPRRGLNRRVLDFIGHFATARQVAMVMTMLVVVALGALWVPHFSRSPELANGTVVHPDPETGPAPSGGVRPADPLDLQMDPTRRRIRTRDEGGQQQLPSEELAAAEAEPETSELGEGQAAKPGLDKDDDELLALRDAPVKRKRSTRPATRERSQASGPNLGRGEGMGGEALAERKAAPDPFPATRDEYAAASGTRNRASASAPARAAGADTDGVLGRPSQAKGESESVASAPTRSRAQELYREATAAYLQGDYKEALAALKELSSRADAAPMRGDADLLNARILRRWRGCAAAIPAYEQVARRKDVQAGNALLELAECHVQNNQPDRARLALQRAAAIGSSASRAKRRLRQLEGRAPSAPAAAEPSNASALEEAQ